MPTMKTNPMVSIFAIVLIPYPVAEVFRTLYPSTPPLPTVAGPPVLSLVIQFIQSHFVDEYNPTIEGVSNLPFSPLFTLLTLIIDSYSK